MNFFFYKYLILFKQEETALKTKQKNLFLLTESYFSSNNSPISMDKVQEVINFTDAEIKLVHARLSKLEVYISQMNKSLEIIDNAINVNKILNIN